MLDPRRFAEKKKQNRLCRTERPNCLRAAAVVQMKEAKISQKRFGFGRHSQDAVYGVVDSIGVTAGLFLEIARISRCNHLIYNMSEPKRKAILLFSILESGLFHFILAGSNPRMRLPNLQIKYNS